MTDGYVVNPDALRDDANIYFSDWKGDLDAIRDAVPDSLSSSDFSNIPGAQDIYTLFTAKADQLVTYVNNGSKQMDVFARTLLLTARDYMIAENYSTEEVNAVRQELNDL